MIYNGMDIAQAAGNNEALRRILETLADQNPVNVGGINDQANLAAQNQPVPPQATWKVQGIDGKTVIDITNPQNINPVTPVVLQRYAGQDLNPASNPIYHRLTSATNKNFDASASVTVYPISTGVHYEFQLPNQTLFWKLESSYDGVNWNTPILYIDPASCGVVAVWSGLARTLSIVLLNSQAMTVDGTNALTQSGVTTTVNVAAKNWNVGTQVIAYNAGSVNPGVFGKFYIYAVDQRKAGGVVTFFATQNIGDLTAQDGIIIFGNITTSGAGGGTGGGGGSCPMTGSMVTMLDGSKRAIETLRRGDVVKGVDGGPETLQCDAKPSVQLCFSLTFVNGITTHGASSTHWLRRDSGELSDVFSSIVGESYRTAQGPSAITAKPFLGLQTVWQIELDRTKTYIVDDTESHNLKP